MSKQITKIIEKLKNSPELLKNIQNKDDAIKFIAQETKMPEAECAKIYDAVVEKVKSGAAEKITGKLGVKLPF